MERPPEELPDEIYVSRLTVIEGDASVTIGKGDKPIALTAINLRRMVGKTVIVDFPDGSRSIIK